MPRAGILAWAGAAAVAAAAVACQEAGVGPPAGARGSLAACAAVDDRDAGEGALLDEHAVDLLQRGHDIVSGNDSPQRSAPLDAPGFSAVGARPPPALARAVPTADAASAPVLSHRPRAVAAASLLGRIRRSLATEQYKPKSHHFLLALLVLGGAFALCSCVGAAKALYATTRMTVQFRPSPHRPTEANPRDASEASQPSFWSDRSLGAPAVPDLKFWQSTPDLGITVKGAREEQDSSDVWVRRIQRQSLSPAPQRGYCGLGTARPNRLGGLGAA